MSCSAGVVRLCFPRELGVVESDAHELEAALLQFPIATLTATPDPSRARTTSHGAAALARAIAEQWRPESGAALDHALAELVALLPDPTVPSRADERPAALEPASVRRARKLLEERFRDALTLEELAEAGGASKFHLARSFRAFHGVPPHTYLTHFRLAIARRLLADGMLGADAAIATGFADQSHFSRSFRKTIGISPQEYTRLSWGDGRRRPSLPRLPT